MLTIEQIQNDDGSAGFDIRAKEPPWRGGPRVVARNIAEAMIAVSHYYGAAEHAQRGSNQECPFCRQMMARDARGTTNAT